ncbi:hypothetical protein HELRODRAFT_192129 [Helobdella robusta]|uniref:Peptidase M12B domain-containing protein n=1 Tax=Helobdella robusta TaxID=6412 RepID=T1FTL8_HELRO|nr:hypothetical protein HELRODRAFT_192129 [Helobdella robusta]ESO03187.1 hypothetical protein HELRODRAFT_192129 [Helobdella robusta]
MSFFSKLLITLLECSVLSILSYAAAESGRNVLEPMFSKVETPLKRSNQVKAVIDFFVVTDHTIYRNWMNFHRNDEAKAIESIKHFYAHVVNEMNNRYMKAHIPGFSVRVVLTGMYISKEKSDLEFIESPNFKINQNTVDGYAVYYDMVRWFDNDNMTRARNFPKFDAAGVFTRYSLNNGVLGLAFISSVCRKNAAFIAQEHGAFRTADLAAHELGHVLGAVNDGEINTCPNNGFIMGSLRNMMDEKQKINYNLNNFHCNKQIAERVDVSSEVSNHKKYLNRKDDLRLLNIGCKKE